MIPVAIVYTFALVITVWLLLRHHSQQAQAWTGERRELVNRIQRPDRLPVESAPEFVVPEFEPDEFDLVGTIQEPLKEER